MSGGSRSRNVRFLDRPDQAGRLGPIALPLGPAAARHAFDHQPGSLEILCGAGRGQKRRGAGPDREVLEVAELLDLAQRVDAGLTGQIEQRLGPNAHIRVAQHAPGRARRSSRRRRH